jgi:hypothetical protein
MMISEKYEDEGGYHSQKNIKTGEIIGAPSFHDPKDKRVRVKCHTC